MPSRIPKGTFGRPPLVGEIETVSTQQKFDKVNNKFIVGEGLVPPAANVTPKSEYNVGDQHKNYKILQKYAYLRKIGAGGASPYNTKTLKFLKNTPCQ